MAQATFHHDDAAPDAVDVPTGTSLMRAAVTEGVPGIVGECGGQAMCATCHVYVREDCLSSLPPMGEDEDEMLDCTAAPRDPERSRLACQLAMSPDLEGIEVTVPASQV